MSRPNNSGVYKDLYPKVFGRWVNWVIPNYYVQIRSLSLKSCEDRRVLWSVSLFTNVDYMQLYYMNWLLKNSQNLVSISNSINVWVFDFMFNGSISLALKIELSNIKWLGYGCHFLKLLKWIIHELLKNYFSWKN